METEKDCIWQRELTAHEYLLKQMTYILPNKVARSISKAMSAFVAHLQEHAKSTGRLLLLGGAFVDFDQTHTSLTMLATKMDALFAFDSQDGLKGQKLTAYHARKFNHDVRDDKKNAATSKCSP